MAVSAYFSDPARVTSISLSLNMQCLLEDGAAPAPFVAELSKVWTELKAWLAERAGPLELHKTHYPQKRNALAAAPDLKKALKERHAFPGGRLEHEATIQGSTVFSYQIYLTYEAR